MEHLIAVKADVNHQTKVHPAHVMVLVLQVSYTVSMPMTVTVDLHILSSPHTHEK